MYTRFFGFSKKPFDVTPDPKFLFLTESHRKALDAVWYGIGERKGFISISGEAGTGKTTILHHLLGALDKSIKTVFITQTQITPKQLLKEITQNLKLSSRDQSKTSLIRQLNENLLSTLSEPGNLAILIDEAQNLSLEVMEELRMLSNLETSTSKLIQIVFVGQPELEEKLNSRELKQLQQRIAIRSQIRPLTADEARQYIDHRLRLVGKSAGEVFSPEAVAMIVRHAEGIPRTINLLCDNALLIGYRRKEQRIPAATAKEVLSDRGLIAEEKGKKITGAEVGPSLPGAGVRRVFPKAALFGIPAALVLIVIFLAGMGHLGFLSAKAKLILAKNEAAVTQEKVSPPNTAQENDPGPPKPSGAPDEKNEPEAAVSDKTANPPDPSPVPVKKPEMKGFPVERGETLYSLLRKHYDQANTTLLDYVLLVNPEISDPHALKPGRQIRIPIRTEESLIRHPAGGDFQIHLATFSQKELAEKFKRDKRLKGRTLQIERHGVSSREIWHRVLASGYKNQEEALNAAKELREKGLLSVFPPVS